MISLRNVENPVALALILALTGGVAALALGAFAHLTAEPRAAAEARTTGAALQELLPEFDNNPAENTVTVESPRGWKITFFGAEKDGNLCGVAASGSTPEGYSGNIGLLLAFETDGTVRALSGGERAAVLVTAHSETPGLGTRVCERKELKTIFNFTEADAEGLAANPVLDQFAGKIVGDSPWQVKKDGGDCEYITGVTVSSRAVTALIYEIAVTYRENQALIHEQLMAKEEEK